MKTRKVLGWLSWAEQEDLARERRFCSADDVRPRDVPLEVFLKASRGEGVPAEYIEKIRRACGFHRFSHWGPQHLSWWSTGNGG